MLSIYVYKIDGAHLSDNNAKPLHNRSIVILSLYLTDPMQDLYVTGSLQCKISLDLTPLGAMKALQNF